MKYEEIIKLLDAGYSREEILQMQQEDLPEEHPEEKQEELPEEKQEDQPEVITGVMKEVKEMFADMKKELTAMNIMNSQIDNKVVKADDAIANIINPFTREGR